MTPEEWAGRLVRVEQEPFCSAVLLPGGQDVLFDLSGPEVGLAVRDAVAGVVRRAVAEALDSGMPGRPLAAGQLAEIGGRAEAATPGPWRVGRAGSELHQAFCRGEADGCHNVWAEPGDDVTAPCARLSEADAAFIAFARQDVPALLAHVDHLEALFRDMADTGEAGAYRRGYADGLKAARQDDRDPKKHAEPRHAPHMT